MKSANPRDPHFVRHAIRCVLESLDQSAYSVSDLSADLSLSREQTHRKLKRNTGLSTGRFIRYIRLLRSAVLLMRGTDPVSSVGYRVGFDDPGYFSKCFSQEFGLPPGKSRQEGMHKSRFSRSMSSFCQLPELPEFGELVIPALNARAAGSKRRRYTMSVPALISLLLLTAFFLISNYSKDGAPDLIMPDNGRVGILPFSNQTGDSLLNDIGEMTSSWLSGKLDELPGVRTVPYFTIKQYAGLAGIRPDDPDGKPTLREVTDASYLVAGTYFLNQGKIYFNARFIDAFSQETVYHLPEISGDADSVMSVIETLRLKVAGLIVNLEEIKLGKYDPPGYESYRNYIKGLEALRNGLYPSGAYEYFKKAARLEPDFVMAQIFVSWFIPREERDSLLTRIGNIEEMTHYERKVYLELHYTYQRKYEKALSVTLDNLKEYPEDYYLNMEAAHLAKSLFYPELSLRILSGLHNPAPEDAHLVWLYFNTWNYTESLALLGEYDSALAYARNIPEQLETPAIPLIQISQMAQLDMPPDTVEAVIRHYSGDNLSLLADNYCAAAYEFLLTGDTVTAADFARQAVTYMTPTRSDKQGFLFDLADAYYLSGQYGLAHEYLNTLLAEDPGNSELRLYLAQVEAKRGNRQEALAVMQTILEGDPTLRWRRHEYAYHPDYLRSRILALTGNHEQALALLENARQEGQLFHNWDFHRDIFLQPLFDHPRFQALTAPKSYGDDIILP